MGASTLLVDNSLLAFETPLGPHGFANCQLLDTLDTRHSGAPVARFRFYACQGWAGDGRKMDNQMPSGANLRESQLDRNNMMMTIKCGRPGRGMPAYDRLAYSDGRCYGQKKADLQGVSLEDSPATLQPREMETLVDFLFAKIVKQGPMDRTRCAAYWGSDAEVCREFK